MLSIFTVYVVSLINLVVSLSDAYKDNFVAWNQIQGKVIRPNLECTNGYIHMVDTVMFDDLPPWAVGSAPKNLHHFNFLVLIITALALTLKFQRNL